MRTFSLVLLGLAVGAALLSPNPGRPAPTPPEPAVSAPALADLETLEFWEQGSYIQPISAPASPAPPRAPGWNWNCTTKKCIRSRPGRSFYSNFQN